METNIKNYPVKIIFAALLLTAVFWYVNSYSKSISPTRSFSVSDEGKTTAIPDIAQLSFGVLTEGGKNLTDLQKENTEKINRVISFLKEKGIEEKDIKTQFYDISPRYQYFNCSATDEISPCPPSEIVGYTINQSVSVKIRKLDKAGDIVAGIVERGANTVSGLTFTIDNPDGLQNKARTEAINKAKEKAKNVAKAGGFRLGKLISIQEGVTFPLPVMSSFEKFGMGGDMVSSPNVEPGSQEIKVNVTLVYEIR